REYQRRSGFYGAAGTQILTFRQNYFWRRKRKPGRWTLFNKFPHTDLLLYFGSRYLHRICFHICINLGRILP
uniref:Uncharacterized protein n=1 Tax=Ciona savignyi TaxID=51511 RepID=H2ZIX6_CIOSA